MRVKRLVRWLAAQLDYSCCMARLGRFSASVTSEES